MENGNKRDDCIFCKIASHKADAQVVFEDENTIAFKDIRPEAPTHILVIPKKHFEKFTDLSAKEDFEILIQIWKSALAVTKKLGIDDACKFQINNGKNAGQIVPHVHLHILSQIKGK